MRIIRQRLIHAYYAIPAAVKDHTNKVLFLSADEKTEAQKGYFPKFTQLGETEAGSEPGRLAQSPTHLLHYAADPIEIIFHAEDQMNSFSDQKKAKEKNIYLLKPRNVIASSYIVRNVKENSLKRRTMITDFLKKWISPEMGKMTVQIKKNPYSHLL